MSSYRNYSDTRTSINSLLSVGIDIGTTSCHLVFSRLGLANEASATQIPKLAIREREVLYESPIHITPLLNNGTINGAAVALILEKEYENAGFKPDDINCGAVIITGETALLRNAEQVLHEISSLAGDFVAASAGPELESILAGRGSGALQYSKEKHKTVCNIDIGGGTTNIAIFENGNLVSTACLRIGGRCFRFTRDGKFLRSNEGGATLLERFQTQSNPAHVHENDFDSIATFAAKEIIDTSRPQSDEGHFKMDEFWFSGGVAELMRDPGTDPFLFEDFGWYLATALNAVLTSTDFNYKVAPSPIRATVLGAGSYSVQLSGNTVSVNDVALPLKGIPLVRPFQGQIDVMKIDAEVITQRLQKAIAVFHEGVASKMVAIVLELREPPKYRDLKRWSQLLAFALERTKLATPHILIVQSDSAMALGQLLRGELKDRAIVVLDGIDLSDGDYIDIGKPLPGGNTIPVTVKSLIFAT